MGFLIVLAVVAVVAIVAALSGCKSDANKNMGTTPVGSPDGGLAAAGGDAGATCGDGGVGDPTHCPPPPDLEIVDRKTGAVVSGTTVIKIVGQKIQLEVRSKPPGHSVANIQWTISGQRIKDYTQSVAAGVQTELSPADLQGTSLDFYWINGGNQTVQVSGQVDGTSKTTSVAYNVLRPTVDKFTVKTSRVSVTLSHFASPGSPVLAAYQATPPPAKMGCQWDAKVTAPAAAEGKIALTQKILVNRSWTNNAGTTRKFGSGGALVLDDGLGIQYSGPKSIAAGGSTTLNGPSYSDSPWIPLLVSDKAASANERFELYLMYKHTDSDSIWVTLRMATWSWAGQTTRIGAPAAPANNWNLPSGAAMTPAGSANGADSSQLPIWTGSYSSASWS